MADNRGNCRSTLRRRAEPTPSSIMVIGIFKHGSAKPHMISKESPTKFVRYLKCRVLGVFFVVMLALEQLLIKKACITSEFTNLALEHTVLLSLIEAWKCEATSVILYWMLTKKDC
ncbi:hypothetical protein H671_3g10942 [Cricetulus griseus]|nr:hypothetical protein H671_3g10942 [Cricetulus griseus]